SGTVTSVQIATDAFLSATGGPITDAGTITMGLAATGTPSASTFLRGDNQWVAPIVSAGITVSNQSVPLTTDVGSFNFIGQGVTVTNVGNDITVNVPLPTSDVTSILAGTGINVSSGTGNVTISKSGVVSLVSGGGLTIVEGAAGVNTLTVTGQTQGTVTSVNAGPGLKLVDGTTSTVAPQLEIQYSGSDNYINRPLTEQAPDAEDIINFQDASSDEVRKVALSDIPVTALTQVNTAISNLNDNAVEHDTDTYTSVPKATKVITLTDAEYTALATKDASTLYLTTSTAPTTGTVQFTIDQTGWQSY
ncbi:phage upper tail fiber protein, partial [Neptunomonas phycophila]|uniref:phage upper tail fiber protein n=1 Tax=Neptunomonas phycophila TaxID=1572645 RepID=UPI0023F8FDD1